MDGALEKHSDSMTEFQSINYMAKGLAHVFEYLNTHELLSASQVCTAWNVIAMDISFWRTVRLKNSMVSNWDKCINTIYNKGSISLDMTHMKIPTEMMDFDKFWLDFTIALQFQSLKRAQTLKYLELYKCPPDVVENTICSLSQLTVLNASSIENPSILKRPTDFMTLNLLSLDQMTNITEIRIKGLTGIKLMNLPSFESLVSLKFLSLTSIKAFPKDICRTLETLTTNLQFFEIGDCDCLSKDFAGVIKRLNNLTSLRLENCLGGVDNIAKSVISAIRGLDKLEILELINVGFTDNLNDELEKCTNIKALLIIPLYANHCAITNRRVINCLKILSKTLTHLVWGLTHESLRGMDLYVMRFLKTGLDYAGRPYLKDKMSRIPILKTRRPRQRPGNDFVKWSRDIDVVSFRALEKLLETLMINGKSKVVKIPFATTTQVHLLEHFNDL